MNYLNPNCFEKTKEAWGIFSFFSSTNVETKNVCPIAYNAQKLPKAAPITAKPGVKGWTEVEANWRLSGNFHVGRRPGKCSEFAEFSGRWNAISKTGSLKNVGITAFTPNYK